MILYFAYGSNMSAARMKQRLGWEAPRRAATLRDFQLVFDQAGFNDPSWSPANIRSEQGGLVEGMVYEVEEKDLKILDGYEKYYQRLEVKVTATQEKNLDAVTYLSKKSRGEKPPTQEYLNFLLEGKKSFLSWKYFDELTRIQVISEESLKQEHLPESS